jgi:AI-2 transport protein TqsA
VANKEVPTSRLSSTARVFTGTAAALALLYFLRAILIPFVIAFVLAVIVDALVQSIRRRWPVAPKWVVSCLAGLLVIGGTAAGILVLSAGTVRLVENGPALLDRLDRLAMAVGRALHLSQPLHLEAVVGTLDMKQVAGFLLAGLQNVGGTLVLIILYFGFMVLGRERIAAKHDAMSGASHAARSPNQVIARIAADVRTYLWVQTVTGAMITAAATAVMLAVGLDNVAFWTVVIFLLTFIPNIGVTVGSVAPALFALLQFPSAWQAITIFAVIQVAAFVVGNLIYPRMQAETQNIDPVATLFALSFWSLLWGISGAFLAVPLTLVLMMIFAQFDSTKWVAALLSNDGRPDLRKSGKN